MRWIRYAIAALGGVLMAAAGMSPQDAASNLAAWADLFGLERIPSWLSNPSADVFAFFVGLGLVISVVALKARRWLQKRHREPPQTPSPSDKTPQDTHDFIESVSIRGHLHRVAEGPSSYWRNVKELTLWQIANLWVNQEPHESMLPGDRAYPILQMLVTDVTNFKLFAAEDVRPIMIHFSGQRKPGVTANTIIKIATLRDYIQKNSHQPLWDFGPVG